MHVVFAAGGTAGHLEPALTTADLLVQRDPTTAVSFVGGSRGLEGELVTARGYPLVATTAQPFPRRLSASAVAFPFLIGALVFVRWALPWLFSAEAIKYLDA